MTLFWSLISLNPALIDWEIKLKSVRYSYRKIFKAVWELKQNILAIENLNEVEILNFLELNGFNRFFYRLKFQVLLGPLSTSF